MDYPVNIESYNRGGYFYIDSVQPFYYFEDATIDITINTNRGLITKKYLSCWATRKDNTNFDYNEEVKKCKTINDVLGKNVLVQRFVEDILENILETEMDEHLVRDKYQRQTEVNYEYRNYRNGYSQKNLRSSFGDVDINIPRDRKTEFEPQIVKKYETVCNELDSKII